jgi:RND family efflux transporter MFP subunit|tara:strand:- start:25649 stop:27028 length:1380 start_codon:yes stop_codon:yes gene_type:complete
VKNSFFLIALLAVLTISCGSDDSSESSSPFSRFGGNGGRPATSVETQNIQLGSIADQVRSYGNVKAQNVISVLPQVSNRLTEIYVDLGDTVRQGQALAKIYDATFRDQLSQARSQLQQTRIAVRRDSSEYERQKSLMERDLTSESEMDIAQAAYQSSRAQFESARSSLTQAQEDFNNTVVRAPVTGVITSRALEVGDLATTGTELFQVASTNGYESRIYLPVQDWRAVAVGQEVNLRLSNESSVSARGIVSRKSPQLDATTGLGEVVITLTSMGNSIYPGVLAENVINITTKDQALIVPRSALVEQVETVINPESNTIELERTYSVFVSRGDSVAERRQLELGIEQGDRIEVLSGLLPNDEIIITGQSGLEDGARIAVASGDQFQAPQERQIGGQEGQEEQAQQGNRPQGRQNPLANMSEEERTKAREEMQGMSQQERMAYLQKLRQQQASSADSTTNE